MTKDQKRISQLEKEIKDLREQLLALAMRPQYIYLPAQPTSNPYVPPYMPNYPIITWGSSANVTTSNDWQKDIRVSN